jgi:carbamoyl-phosphate synthase small subunit
MSRNAKQPAILALSDGTVFNGSAFGAVGETAGEIVFNTAMTGYQEILTDPSYRGQLVCMTYPQIGNTGVNPEDVESGRIYAEGFVVKEYISHPSNWRSTMPLGDYLKSAEVVGIEGIDTRTLVRHIRTFGAQEAVISSVDLDPGSLVRKAKASPGLVGRDLIKEVTCREPYVWETSDWSLGCGYRKPDPYQLRDAPLLVALDFGIKRNILRRLVATGFRVIVMPATATSAQILAKTPNGVFLSNGPGGLWDLSRSPDSWYRSGRQNLQTGFRPSWREPSGCRPPNWTRRDHFAKPRLRCRRRLG